MKIILIFHLIRIILCERNNVCKEFAQYNFRDASSDCWYNPDVNARADEIIKRHGYPVEEYKVETEDFFILTVYRIPPRNVNVKGVVFLQHPALSSCTVWLASGNDSFAFLLSNDGYDVWLGNFRTTSYSEKHKFLSKYANRNQYWNSSFHEFGIYDLPAQIDLVMRKTAYRQKIIYIGHSVATTAGLIYSSLKPNVAETNIRLFIFWSPIAFLGNVRTPFKAVTPFVNLIQNTLTSLGVLGITFEGTIHRVLARVCLSTPLFMQVCSIAIDYIVGPQIDGGNPATFPFFWQQSIEGFSVKTLAHFGQLVQAKDRFQWYDYGRLLNTAFYASTRPPVYPLENITIPMYIVYGSNDYFSTEKDAYILYSRLQNHVRKGIKNAMGLSHFDFHYAKELKQLLHIPTLNYLDKFIKSSN